MWQNSRSLRRRNNLVARFLSSWAPLSPRDPCTWTLEPPQVFKQCLYKTWNKTHLTSVHIYLSPNALLITELHSPLVSFFKFRSNPTTESRKLHGCSLWILQQLNRLLNRYLARRQHQWRNSHNHTYPSLCASLLIKHWRYDSVYRIPKSGNAATKYCSF